MADCLSHNTVPTEAPKVLLVGATSLDRPRKKPMMFALIALVQSAFACGPYGNMAFSEDGAAAFDSGDSIEMWTSDGDRVQLPVFGDVVDLDFVGEELLVAYQDEQESFVVLFDQDGDELADWSPRNADAIIQSVWVLRDGLVVNTALDGAVVRTRLTDDLRMMTRLTSWGAGQR